MSDSKDETALVLQGGGARGAYQAGALLAVAHILNRRENPFPVISGASVGAINAASLASSADDFRLGAERLARLWRGLKTNRIFDTRARAVIATSATWLWTIIAGGLGIASPCALFDNRPLRELLTDEFEPQRVRRSLANGSLKAFCITASSYEAGQAVTYFESSCAQPDWKRVRRLGIRAPIDVDHLMASSALPLVFPAVRLKQGYFGDGALRLTAPLSPAIRLGAKRILVVGVRDAETPSLETQQNPTYPTIGEMSGHALDILFNDNLDADIERLERINGTLDAMTDEARESSGLRKISILVLQPTKDLRDIARDHEFEMPRTVRIFLRSLGAWHKDGRLPSYLLFEPGYIDALIKLGYDDTMARKHEIRQFLT